MRKYVVRRLFAMGPTLLLMSLFVFFLLRILPGDVTQLILGDSEGGIQRNQQRSVETLRRELGLDKPIHIQYLTWISDVLRGNLGKSLLTGKSVTGEMLHRLPITIQIGLMAQITAILIGVPMGIVSALKRGSWLDLLLRFWSIVFLAAPSFWVGLMILMGGVLAFNWSPPMGYNPIWENPKESMLQLMWPAMILASHQLAILARMTRSTMLEVLREDYIRTARAKGLREQVVVYRHALKNAMIPVITLAGISFANLLGGTVILEQVFSIPGMGRYLISAIQQRDYTVIQGVLVIFAVFFMLVNLTVDLLYGWLDPRISYS